MTALGVSDLTDPLQYARNRFKIAAIGTDRCGKTAFARRLARNIFCEPGTADASEPFRQVFHKKMSDGTCAKVELIDVGMEQLNEHSRTANIIRQRMVIDGAPTSTCTEFVDLRGIFLLYDITDGKSFTELSNIIGDLSHLISPDCEIFLIGCKADRREDRKVSFKDAEDMSLKIGFSLFETSAKSGANCELALTEMLEKVYEKHEEAASYVCDATEEAEPPPRFNLPHIFCQMWNCG
uniref:Ras-related and estrogen-regulated growth inhibitor n=1 Tax=Ascaris lumbricoides TaxID=6252 RepID=A0A0M3HPZ6_ASCLU